MQKGSLTAEQKQAALTRVSCTTENADLGGCDIVIEAATEQEAVDIARRARPGLILADINLGIGGDGKSAVARSVESHYAPVIFVTAYPERLLTGEAFEPAFVITKPFEPLTLAVATYQAVTGGVRLD